MSNTMDYSIGDSVLIKSEELKKKVIGCIEELDVVEGVFRYGLYVQSKEVPKRQYYHGNFELLKTSSSFEDKLTSIEKCVEVLKFKDYVMREQPTEEQPFYMIRQYYDMHEETLTPSEPKPCICDRVVNPDGNLVMCLNCTDLFYHDTCLAPGAKCSGCLSILKEENLVGFKRNSSIAALPAEAQIESLSLKQISTSSVREDDMQEEIEPTKMNIDVDKMKEMFEQARLANLRKQEDRRRQIKQKATNGTIVRQASATLKRDNSGNSSSLEFSNLSSGENEKIQNFVARYKRFNPTGNLVGPEKKRMEVREKFFEYMVYGLLEMESTEAALTDDERRFIKQDFYEIARKLAVEIESNIFNVNNRSNKYALTDNYKQRCKLLFTNMRDSLNFHLRRSIINKSIKPLSLCTMTEIELYNPTKLKEIENQQMKMLDRDTISLSDKLYIFKTSKGEEIINMREEIQINKDDDENQDPHNQPASASKQSITFSSKPDISADNFSENQQNSLDLFPSLENIEPKTVSKNPLFDKSIVESLLNFVGEKSIKRIKDRIISDLPEKEANYLLSKLAC